MSYLKGRVAMVYLGERSHGHHCSLCPLVHYSGSLSVHREPQPAKVRSILLSGLKKNRPWGARLNFLTSYKNSPILKYEVQWF